MTSLALSSTLHVQISLSLSTDFFTDFSIFYKKFTKN